MIKIVIYQGDEIWAEFDHNDGGEWKDQDREYVRGKLSEALTRLEEAAKADPFWN